MIQKVLKVGDSIVITIPKEFLKALDLEVGDKVDVKLDKEKKEIVITPAARKDKELIKLIKKFIKRYRSDLEELAKK